MAFESTAINDFIAGVNQRPLEREPNDWLFGERDDATQIDPSGADASTTPFDRRTPSGTAVPAQSFGRAPAGDDPVFRPQSPTTHVRMTDWAGIAKRLALPIGMFCIVVVAVGVYVAKTDESKAAPAAQVAPSTDEVKAAPVAKAEAARAAAAAVASADDVANVEASAAASVPANVEPPVAVGNVEPPAAAANVDEPKVEVSIEAVKIEAPAAPAKAKAAAAAPAPVAAAAPAPVVAAAPVTAPEPPKPVEPQVVIEPGTPAARFLAAAPVQPTIPTVAAKPAPAPTAVAGLNPPAKTAPTAPAKPAVAAAPAKAAPTKVARKSAAQLRAEKRAAAKAAAKASLSATKARSQKRVAARDDADDEDDDAPAKPTAAKGKGFLQIASTPAMQVWVDGRNSNAQTPVRIKLLAGKHKVTLFDKEHGGKARSFEIEIRPDETTKVVKSY